LDKGANISRFFEVFNFRENLAKLEGGKKILFKEFLAKTFRFLAKEKKNLAKTRKILAKKFFLAKILARPVPLPDSASSSFLGGLLKIIYVYICGPKR